MPHVALVTRQLPQRHWIISSGLCLYLEGSGSRAVHVVVERETVRLVWLKLNPLYYG